jgi:hypothetical protein
MIKEVFSPLTIVQIELFITLLLLLLSLLLSSLPNIIANAKNSNSFFGYTMYMPSVYMLNPGGPDLKHSDRLVLAGSMYSVPIMKTIE